MILQKQPLPKIIPHAVKGSFAYEGVHNTKTDITNGNDYLEGMNSKSTQA